MQPGADKDATDANGERPLYWATESTVGGGWEARRSEPLAALVAEARLHTRAGQSGAGRARATAREAEAAVAAEADCRRWRSFVEARARCVLAHGLCVPIASHC
jgi:hypothetical protein